MTPSIPPDELVELENDLYNAAFDALRRRGLAAHEVVPGPVESLNPSPDLRIDDNTMSDEELDSLTRRLIELAIVLAGRELKSADRHAAGLLQELAGGVISDRMTAARVPADLLRSLDQLYAALAASTLRKRPFIARSVPHPMAISASRAWWSSKTYIASRPSSPATAPEDGNSF